ncbi:MAG: EAL domain-containing protein [Pseudomonadota bacterium]
MNTKFLNEQITEAELALMPKPRYWMAWLTLLLGLSLTFFAWRSATSYVHSLSQQRFQTRVQQENDTLSAYLAEHAQALRGVQTYVGMLGQVTEQDWRRLYQTLRFGEHNPGFDGIGYLQVVSPQAQHPAPNRLNHRAAETELLTAGALHLLLSSYQTLNGAQTEPTFNLHTLGLARWPDLARTQTLESTRDSGETQLSNRLSAQTQVLAKGQDAATELDFIMCQAVYRHGLLPETLAARRNNLIGFVFAPFRGKHLLEQFVRAQGADIALRIYDDAHDGASLSAKPPFYTTHPELDFTQAKHHRLLPIKLGGQVWQLEYAALPNFDTQNDLAQPWRVLAGGLLVSLLLFCTVCSLVATRTRALRIAERMTHSLREQEGKLRALFEQAPLAIWMLDEKGRVLECNDKLIQHMGAPRERIIGFSMISDVKDQSLVSSIQRALAGETVMIEGPYTSTTGNLSSIYQFYFQPVQLEGEFAFLLAFAQDISARKAVEARIEHIAHHDNLTGLANRLLLKDRLDNAIANAQRNPRMQALLFVDLDHFKTINDTVGHAVGDALLLEVAQRLRECVRESDTLARIGGDEFIILLTNLASASDCERVAEKLIDSLARPINVDQNTFSITASVGIAFWPSDGLDSETLTRNADAAMYHAKNSGRNNYQLFKQEMSPHVVEGLSMETALVDALANNQLLLHFQARVEFDSRLVVAAEALLRWQHPTFGILLPSRFMPMAEERGLVDKLHAWILRQACRHARTWQLAGLPIVPVVVSISATQFRSESLCETILEALQESGLPPEYLTLEITEHAVMAHLEKAITILLGLAAIGVSINIDDCGMGYSAPSYLRRLPIQRLKIDQSLVNDIQNQESKGTVSDIEHIVSISRNLQLSVVADGVNNAYQAAFLYARGCRTMQGNFFARPEMADEFARTLARQIISTRKFVDPENAVSAQRSSTGDELKFVVPESNSSHNPDASRLPPGSA